MDLFCPYYPSRLPYYGNGYIPKYNTSIVVHPIHPVNCPVYHPYYHAILHPKYTISYPNVVRHLAD